MLTMLRLASQCGLRILCLLAVSLFVPAFARAQDTAADNHPANTVSTEKIQQDAQSQNVAPASSGSDSGSAVTLFPHSLTSRYWISGQANVVMQWNPTLPAKYSGKNSFGPAAQNATSRVYTLFLGYQLTRTTEVFLDVESAGGHGLSNALGLAGFLNLDVVRNPELGDLPYIARVMIRQIIPLGGGKPVDAQRGPLALATSLPARRLEIRLGKFTMPDFFDLNTYGTDSHLQFLNWTVDNNGAFDYSANTRGYTDGLILEYDDHWWTVRFAETLMSKVANGINLDANLARSRASTLEFEARGKLIAHRDGVVRLLTYLNAANMGNYEQAIRAFENGETEAPDIISTRRQGRHRYGFGLNADLAVTPQIGIFGRLGWSDGRNEAYEYTEVDRTFQLGAFSKGDRWKRPNDRTGIVFVANGIVKSHQQYLALGGLGFLLGDGALTYGPEKILEAFYTTHIGRGFFASFDVQHINNPGYNKDRSPLVAPGLRLHVDF
ncbi:MAG: carbohydrate porin [Candidatus Acidiferrales bacterium]